MDLLTLSKDRPDTDTEARDARSRTTKHAAQLLLHHTQVVEAAELLESESPRAIAQRQCVVTHQAGRHREGVRE